MTLQLFKTLLLKTFKTVLVFVFAVFVSEIFVDVLPGNPVDFLLGDEASLAQKNALAEQLNLRSSFPYRFYSHFKNLILGDWGSSFYKQESVLVLVFPALIKSLMLALAAVLIASVFALVFNMYLFLVKSKTASRVLNIASMISLSVPMIVLGPLFIYFFAYKLSFFSVLADESFFGSFWPASIAVSLILFGPFYEVLKNAVKNESCALYTTAELARGISRPKIFITYVLKSSFTPVLTVLSKRFAGLLSGAVVTESIFNYSGLGMLFFEALSSRDFFLIQGCFVAIFIIYILVSELSDFFIVLVDKRVEL